MKLKDIAKEIYSLVSKDCQLKEPMIDLFDYINICIKDNDEQEKIVDIFLNAIAEVFNINITYTESDLEYLCNDIPDEKKCDSRV